MWRTDSKTNIFQRQWPCYQSVTCVKADTTPHKYEALTFCTPSVWRLQHAHVFLLHSSVQPDAFHDTVNDSYGCQRDLDPGSVGESPASSPPSHGRSYTIYITRKNVTGAHWKPGGLCWWLMKPCINISMSVIHACEVTSPFWTR